MTSHLDILVVGGGPAGLYAALLLKKARPDWAVRVVERNQPDDTFGWGVVFSAETLGNLGDADGPTLDAMAAAMARWDDIDIQIPDTGPDQTTGAAAAPPRFIRSTGHGFRGIARHRLLAILRDRARDLGVALEFGREITDIDALAARHDLIIAADGINSRVRDHHAADFAPDIDLRPNRYVWLGTTRDFDAFTFLFERAPADLGGGWFQAHAYRYAPGASTFIIETTQENWRRAGLDQADTAATIAFGQRLFARHLDGHPLIANTRHPRGSAWLNFPRLSCGRWVRNTIVLLGDAAHTAHFSIGSGTKLAMEDAIALADAVVASPDDLPAALSRYEGERRSAVARIQSAARNSMEWFESVERYTALEPERFAYSLLTRSQRIGHANLGQRDPAGVRAYEAWLARRSGVTATPPPPPMFTPLRLRGLTLANRVVLSPMALYSAVDGTVGDFHLVHYGSRAIGGAGLLVTEMTCVAADARITPGCAGLYAPEHLTAWRRIVDFVHGQSGAAFCLQLGHAGPKGATRVPWSPGGRPGAGSGDVPLEQDGWPLVAASPLAWGPGNAVPTALDRDGMDRVVAQFVAAARLGDAAGFDMLELHAAHGYLLSSFLSPLSNRRTDAYGGSLENRARFPLDVLTALRAVWPADKPLSVRLSATDWHPDGLTPADAVILARLFQAAGADLIDVSAGQTSRDARPVYGRMFQTPFSDRIRNEVGIATMAVGNITDADQINSIIAAGRADLVALARPHLADPYFTLHAAAAQGVDVPWPAPYIPGRDQLRRRNDPAAAPLRDRP